MQQLESVRNGQQLNPAALKLEFQILACYKRYEPSQVAGPHQSLLRLRLRVSASGGTAARASDSSVAVACQRWPRLSGTAWWQRQQAASDSSVACQRWPRAAARYVWPGPGVAARVCIGTYSSLQLSRSLRAGKLSQRLGLAGRLSLTGASHPYYILPLSSFTFMKFHSLLVDTLACRRVMPRLSVRTPAWATANSFYSCTILVSLWYVLVYISTYTFVLVCVCTFRSVVMLAVSLC